MYQGKLVIPYFDKKGPTTLRFRSLPGMGGPKYMDLPGARSLMYNVRAIGVGGNALGIAEGEIDCMTLNQMGITAVGLSGAQKWKPSYRNLLAGYSTVRVFCDNDDSGVGMEMGQMIKTALPNAYVQLLPAPEGHDVNSAYLEGGREHLLNYWGLLEEEL